MKADLPVREPAMLARWEKSGLYEKIQETGKGKPVFLLHDGPPYANGAIHIGHALNKILKDFVVKYKTLAGFHSPYVPGWDCHGLPIEHQLFKTLGKNKHQVSRIELRKLAADYALRFVEEQRKDFQRLGVFGDWAHPYLTLSNEYEATIVKTFFELKDKNFIYRGLKPGYWCAFDETALAEAEVEYADKKSDSVFVRFKFTNRNPRDGNSERAEFWKKLDPFIENLYVLIWTTTPWTLPANRALAFHPQENYVLVKKDSDFYLVAEKLREAVAKKIQAEVIPETPKLKGKEFLNFMGWNPLTQSNSRLVNANYVTMEDGTGIVHIAPGHGVEDYAVGLENGLEVFSPVDERGCFNDHVRPLELKGKHVLKDANSAVMEILQQQGDLLFHESHKHSYPHCWRCKNPIIFRATEQWFLGIEPSFRQKLLEAIDSVVWEPAFGIHRIKGMVETRPDWCLSRQRHWGAPIAVFYCASKTCGHVLWDSHLNSKLVGLIREKGASVYYEKSETELFQELNVQPKCGQCGGSEFKKEMDILDVWFDSGVSWAAVVEERLSRPKPEKVMYLEGSDQHRGWFQTSLIPSVALRAKPPYDVVLTHGFIVDGKGHKMSKSQGNVVSPQDVIQKYGADVLRLWVAMSDYREDVRVSQDIIKHMVDVYRRFRNTFRFLLQNTADFKWQDHRVDFGALQEIDRWVLSRFDQVREKAQKMYESYEFHVVLGELNRFVAVELSGFYLDALKDRLYCEEPDSPLRRSTQTALFVLARGLSVLLAPLLSFTSEEAYLELRSVSAPDLPESVFLNSLASLQSVAFDEKLDEKWINIIQIRSTVNNELDKLKKAGVIGSSQQARVIIPASMFTDNKNLSPDSTDWPFVLQVAEVDAAFNGSSSAVMNVEATSFSKCERCWRYRGDVGKVADHPALCARCARAVSSRPAAV